MSIYRLFSSLLSQEGPLGPHLEPSLCYWIQSLKVIKLHPKHSIEYRLPPNLAALLHHKNKPGVWQVMVTFLVVPSPIQGVEAEGDDQWL